jgi:signal transduction histidine kinase
MHNYIPLFGAAVNLLLALFVLSRSAKSIANRVYFLLGLCIAIWNFGTYRMFEISTSEEALFWARFLQFGVIYIPALLFHLSLLVAQIRVGTYIYLLYALQSILAAANLVDVASGTTLFLSGARDLGFAWYSIAGPGFWAYCLTFNLTVLSILILVVKRRQLPPLHKKRLNGLIVAQSALVVLGANDILPILGIESYPLLGGRIYPFGSMSAIFYGVIVAYSVLHHQLLDVRLTLGRLAAQLVRLIFVMVLGGVLLLIASQITQSFNVVSFFSTLLVLLLTVIIASIYFPRLFGKGEETIERSILGDRFEYHDQIRSFVQSMSNYTDSRLLLDDLHDLLIKTMRIRSYQIILREESSRAFALFRSHPETGDMELPQLRWDSPVFQYFRQNPAGYLPFRIAYALPQETSLERDAKQQFSALDPEFAFPFFADGEPFGLFFVGDKLSGDHYTQQDLRLLIALVNQLSIHMNQVRLNNQIQSTQEQELLGRMSRGMAHDLNNLLTPAQTLLQLLAAGFPREDALQELLPIALRNVETIRAYINDALFFSNTQMPQFALHQLGQVTERAVELILPEAQKRRIQIEVDSLPDAEIEMDSVQIQRLVSNLLGNAIEASNDDSTVRVRLTRLPKTEFSRDWYRIQIIDAGEGISEDNLRRIMMPYFSTKNQGDGRRGFGLGLAIARKMVHLHGGNLSIASKEKKGTTVQVDLPSRQLHQETPTRPEPVAVGQ